MRKLLFLFAIIPFLTYSQTVDSYRLFGNDGLELYFVATAVDSGSNPSASFKDVFNDWLRYSQDLTTYDVGYEYSLDTLTASGEIMGIYLEGKTRIGTWNKVDTLLASDTLKVGHAGLTGFGISDFNQSSYGSFPEYRINFDASASDSTGNTFTGKLSLFFRKKN